MSEFECCDFGTGCPDHFFCILPRGHEGDHGGYADGPCDECYARAEVES